MHFVTPASIINPDNGLNVYRGCTHGCIYCDSRSVCYRMNHDFEDVAVKRDAPRLLDDALRRRRAPAVIATGAMSDPYNPLEAELLYTRGCLEAILRRGFGATVLTKSTLVLRDLDLLAEINRHTRAVAQMTLTTADPALTALLEPNAAPTLERAAALEAFAARGVPTAAWLSPFLPFLNDTEENLRALLKLCFGAGVRAVVCFGIGLTLREGNREYFYTQLDRFFPGLKRRYCARYGDAYVLLSDRNDALMAVLRAECERRGVLHEPRAVFEWLCRLEPHGEQLRFL